MVDMSALRSRAKNATADSGEASLNKLGYKQELKRGFSFMNNAAMSFRCTTHMYTYQANYGIPNSDYIRGAVIVTSQHDLRMCSSIQSRNCMCA